jgi:hypothetical protein
VCLHSLSDRTVGNFHSCDVPSSSRPTVLPRLHVCAAGLELFRRTTGHCHSNRVAETMSKLRFVTLLSKLELFVVCSDIYQDMFQSANGSCQVRT